MIDLKHGDCLEQIRTLEDNSVDSIVTDPPYGLSFMGKKWDIDVPSVEIWQEAFRVLKPGGHLISFGGTRTYHRMAVAIEDAGFEIRDMVSWIYGSGFPKSLNIGKAVDKLQGNEREKVGDMKPAGFKTAASGYTDNKAWSGKVTKGNSAWEGWGTALKPAQEPCVLARKPLSEKTVAENVLKWGTGGLNIDGCRVGNEQTKTNGWKCGGEQVYNGRQSEGFIGEQHTGRFPANIIHDGSDEVLEVFPETKDGVANPNKTGGEWHGNKIGGRSHKGFGGKGSAARFFYCAKSSRKDRNTGLDGTCTVKYNTGICKEENMEVVHLLRKVTSELTVKWNIDESGANIMALCQQDSLSTTLTKIRQIIESKTYNSLMPSRTNESTQVVNSKTESGGSLVENVETSNQLSQNTTSEKTELALGVGAVVLKTLQVISVEENWKPMTNVHSTVKPIALMEYMIKLITPPNGTVLDPYMGSGSTGIAAKNLGHDFIGIEREEEYVEIAKARIESV